MNYQQAKERAKILKALAHPMRILIVEALQKGDRCGSELCALGSISQSNVSRHLATLKRVGVVSDRRIRNRVFYRLETPSVLNVLEPAAQAVRTDIKRRTERTKAV
jgi:DNA-binding transcriptional ArsR family regulator